MMTEDCTDILNSGDDRAKILNITSNSYSNIVYFSGNKNPFDRQFELALKNGLTYPNLSSSTSNNTGFNPSSPLNTPLIPPDSAFNSSAIVDLPSSDPSPAITPAQINNLLLDCEININHNNNNNQNQRQTKPQNEQATTANDDNHNKDDNQIIDETTIIEKESKKESVINNDGENLEKEKSKIKHRSNMVSVICPPVPTFRDEKIRSAPVILPSANRDEITFNENNPNPENASNNEESRKFNKISPIVWDKPSSKLEASATVIETILPGSSSDMIVVNNNNNNKETCSVVTSSSELSVPAIISQQSQVPVNFQYSIAAECPPFKKILPKQQNCNIDSSSGGIAQRVMLSSQPPARRKEKTLDELMNKIKATEAALPPKAKPGRKSKTAREEDSKERKRLSLERNRAAAMRCRLKKKKEIDELKQRVESYEQQNQQLNKIIDSLCAEVAYLKNELLRHKDCN